jgi:hypothetical protein
MTQGEYCMLKFDTIFAYYVKRIIFLTHLLFNFIISTYLSHLKFKLNYRFVLNFNTIHLFGFLVLYETMRSDEI